MPLLAYAVIIAAIIVLVLPGSRAAGAVVSVTSGISGVLTA